MITPNMTIKDRERRAALLADSPELPSKPPLDWYVQLFSLLEFPTENNNNYTYQNNLSFM